MKVIYKSYREERVYHAVAVFWDGLFATYFYALATVQSLWWWVAATLFLLMGTDSAIKFTRVKKETYADREANKPSDEREPPDR